MIVKSNQLVYGKFKVSEIPFASKYEKDYAGVPAAVSYSCSFPQTIKLIMIPVGAVFKSYPVLSVLKFTLFSPSVVFPSVYALRYTVLYIGDPVYTVKAANEVSALLLSTISGSAKVFPTVIAASVWAVYLSWGHTPTDEEMRLKMLSPKREPSVLKM